MIDVSTIFAGGASAIVVFALFRGYSMWKSWSNTSKTNEEIEMDKKIAEAIKAGDVELIARLRKYYLAYKKKCQKTRPGGRGFH